MVYACMHAQAHIDSKRGGRMNRFNASIKSHSKANTSLNTSPRTFVQIHEQIQIRNIECKIIRFIQMFCCQKNGQVANGERRMETNGASYPNCENILITFQSFSIYCILVCLCVSL